MANGSNLWTSQRAVKPHLVRGTGGVAAEVGDLRDDLTRELAPLAALTVEEFTNVAAADPNGIKTSIASSDAIQTYTGAALNGVVGAGTMSPPRNITITTTTHADIDAVDVVITGLDINGDTQTDTITLTDGGNATDVGTMAFASVSSIVVPAQSGTGGALEFGFGDVIGLGKQIVTRAGLATAIKEIAVGAVVTNGVFVAAATSGPNGTYEPNTVPNGTNDYALYYEYDPTA